MSCCYCERAVGGTDHGCHERRGTMPEILVSTLINGLVGSAGAVAFLFVAHLIWGEF